MILVIGALILGFLAAHYGLIPQSWEQAITKINRAALLLLLFSMGLSLGSNPELLAALPSLGLKSFGLASGIIIGSVGLTWLVFSLKGIRS